MLFLSILSEINHRGPHLLCVNVFMANIICYHTKIGVCLYGSCRVIAFVCGMCLTGACGVG